LIVERAARLREFAAQKDQARRISDQLTGFRSRASQVQGEKADLAALLETYSLLCSREVRVPVPREQVRVALRQLEEVEAQYAAAPETLLAPRAYAPLADGLATLRRTLKAGMQEAWAGYVDSRVPLTDADLLDVLARVPAFRGVVQRIRTLVQEIREQRAVLPDSGNALTALDERVEGIESAWRALASDEVPREVVVFLREAGIAGARLDLLTDGVRRWLADRGIADSFRIRLVSERGV